MSERLFLYIDILGFKDLVQSGFDIREVYRRIDSLNAHSDRDFTCIVFSDTIFVYGDEGWLPKLNRNRERDKRKEADLRNLGWDVLTVWECETRDMVALTPKIVAFLEG